MIVLDLVGGGGSEKFGLVAGRMGFGVDVGTLLRPWLMAGGGKLKVLSAAGSCVSSLPRMSPDAAGVGGRHVRGMVEEQVLRLESSQMFWWCGGALSQTKAGARFMRDGWWGRGMCKTWRSGQ